MESEELRQLAAVLRIFVYTQLDVLAEGLVELVEVVLVLRYFGEQVKALFDDILPDDLKDFVLLQRLARNVERQILGVDDPPHEIEVFGNDVFAIVHDKDASDVELDVVAFLLRFKQVERRAVAKY